MTKITIIEAKDAEEKYAIGDWFLRNDSLYLLVQHEQGKCKMICVEEEDANRVTSYTLDWTVYGYCALPKHAIDKLMDDSDWQKVSVEIKVIK